MTFFLSIFCFKDRGFPYTYSASFSFDLVDVSLYKEFEVCKLTDIYEILPMFAVYSLNSSIQMIAEYVLRPA